jgi:tRNA(Ile)-lysidine synthase
MPSRHDSDTAACQRVWQEIRRVMGPERGAGPAPLIVAVSGGADSVCLCDALAALRDDLALSLTVAHLDHGLRGDASRDDAAYVQRLSESLGLPCLAERADVAALARERRLSIEAAARQARYAFLARAARAAGAARIALAHHADDQAETVLLRLLRGTGIAGLRGMQARAPHPAAPDLTLIRPLLHLTRADTERYCAARGLTWRADATNDETDALRNRIRHELLPLLARYNPGIRKVLARLADTAAEDLEMIDYATREACARVAQAEAGEWPAFDRAAWRALPAPLQRGVLREAARQAAGDTTDLAFAAIEEARDVLSSDALSGSIDLTARVRATFQRASFQVSAVEQSAVSNQLSAINRQTEADR